MNNKYKAKMTDKQRKEAVELYLNSDLRLEDIAAKYGCSTVAIYKLVKKHREKEEAGQ